MKVIECGIKAFDIHELLCHFVAKRCGFYVAAGLDVRLVDTTFTPDERLPDADFFQVACGAAFQSRTVPFRIFLAAVTKPMFWLYAGARIAAVEQLAGKRIATYPALAPPYWFNRIALRNHGLDPDHDVEMLPARDDVARLGLLREGAVDAALISSAISPVADPTMAGLEYPYPGGRRGQVCYQRYRHHREDCAGRPGPGGRIGKCLPAQPGCNPPFTR